MKLNRLAERTDVGGESQGGSLQSMKKRMNDKDEAEEKNVCRERSLLA